MELYSKYHHLIEQTTQAGLWEYDYSIKKMRWSSYVYSIFNCADNFEPTIETDSGFFMSKSLDKLIQSINYLEHNQIPFSGIFDIRLPHGTIKTLAISMDAEFSGQTILRRFGTIRDITQQHQQTIESEFFRERVELALKASAIGTWDYHVANDHLYWDESMQGIFDLASYSSINEFKDWIDLIHPEDRNQFIEQFNIGAKGLAENNTILLTCRTISHQGQISFVRMYAQFYFNDNHQNIRILGTCVDTTESEISQREIINQASISQQNMLKAQDLTAARTRFLANMSHEIRTPMNAIMGALQILHTYDLDEDSYSLTEMALDSSKDLLNIINDILDLSKIDASHMTIEAIPLQLNALLTSAFNKFTLSLDKDIELELLIAPELNPYRIGDPTRLTQIINNLVSNAIKFTHQGSVKVLLTGDAERIELIVSDTGIGIPQDTLQNIFEPFRQADNSTTRNYGGTGLGLAICSSLTSLMDGTLRVFSEDGVGTEFIFNAPLPITAMTLNTINAPINEPVPDLSDFTILVAEDNPSNQVIIQTILSNTGANIHIYDNGKQALAAYNQFEHVDLLILDINMPIMNGIDMCLAIRKTNKLIPILALSADIMLQNKSVLNHYGFTDTISKPLQLEQLYQFIHTYCSVEQA
ncbi:MAG: ATP-binding protein [Glaciecola sp.]|nr:ATP-binding protein [Glaciecola sp.]MDG1814973.1 ATP-binding protein [Glaciecola sp.]MDG2100671.1 ATP-binding protein [Glaciecola sp.]